MATERQAIALAKARAFQRATGRYGGRPKGVLNPSTIARIQNEKAMREAIQKRAGRIVNNLFISSDYLDTTASKELLERGFGKVQQDIGLTGEFQLKAVHMHVLPAVALPHIEGQPSAPQLPAHISSVPLIEQ